jgi:TPP-dependent indolepyruvate ferredoxin oxidoreductase alpha subunit
MTGGQQAEGHLSPDQMARQVAAEGVSRIAVVSDDPDKYPAGTLWPPGTTLHHRDDLDAVQRELATVSAASRCCSTTRPAPPRSAAGASAAPIPIRTSASSSTSWSARDAAIAG